MLTPAGGANLLPPIERAASLSPAPPEKYTPVGNAPPDAQAEFVIALMLELYSSVALLFPGFKSPA